MHTGNSANYLEPMALLVLFIHDTHEHWLGILAV